MTEFETLLSSYDYPISPDHIALGPANPRDSSRILIYERKSHTVLEDTFSNLAQHLPEGALLIFNDTKVIPARLPAHIETGGRVELLCTRFEGAEITALCERFLPEGALLRITESVQAKVLNKIGSEYSIRLLGAADVKPLLQELGSTPLPPYLKHSPLSEDERREKYQAIFAKNDGSIAAPTASLHFTERVMNSFKPAGIEWEYVTLHVNLGTFMPLTEEAVQAGQLHEERFEIPQRTLDAIGKAKAEGRPVIAVGTTALRALESHALGLSGSTRLFIQEGFVFKIVDGLITNFHVPKSSLMMLVAALVGKEKLLELYALAKERGFRFFSFGDAMLIK